jgi:chromosome segregation ATPase
MMLIALASTGDWLTGGGAFITACVLVFQAFRSWRQGPAVASLTEAQAATEREKFWQNALAEVRASLLEARAEADRANERVDQVLGQIDSLREAKDAMELDFRRQLREEREARERDLLEERKVHDRLASRIGRLEDQVRTLGQVPVA